MMLTQRIPFNVLSGMLCIFAWGCATVNPQPDYDRAAQYVAQATGQEVMYRPDREAAVEGQTQTLLANGITAQQAVQICLLNNPRLQAAFFTVGIASADVVQSRLFSNPSFAVSPRFPDSFGPVQVEASVAQNIVELWQIPVRRREAEQSRDQAIFALSREVSTAILAAKTAYVQALKADREQVLIQENVQIAQQLADLAVTREEAGVGSIVDINLARSELLKAELSRKAAALSRLEARAALAKLLGLTTPPEDLQLIDALPDPPQWTLEPERLLALARASRFDLKAAEQAVHAAEAHVQLEHRKFLPSLEVGGVRDAEDRTGPSVEFVLPLFDQNQARVARAIYQYQQAEKMLDALLRELPQDTRLAYERARTAWETSHFYRDQLLPLRETSLNISREAYEAGRASFLQVLEAERTLLETRAGYVATLQNSAAAVVELERVTGQPVSTIFSDLSSGLPANSASPSPGTPKR
jgi:outer membrane protein, heavy metal efflux system